MKNYDEESVYIIRLAMKLKLGKELTENDRNNLLFFLGELMGYKSAEEKRGGSG